METRTICFSPDELAELEKFIGLILQHILHNFYQHLLTNGNKLVFYLEKSSLDRAVMIISPREDTALGYDPQERVTAKWPKGIKRAALFDCVCGRLFQLLNMELRHYDLGLHAAGLYKESARLGDHYLIVFETRRLNW